MTLLELQRTMAAALMQPRVAGGKASRKASGLIVRNSRLSSMERLRIYQRSYWARVMDSLRDDFPGLVAILGTRAFARLAKAYLAECPSQSFTLRDLGAELEAWLRRRPEYAGTHWELALDMVRLEWAHIEAFDGAEEKALGPEDLLELTPLMELGMQPHVRLLPVRFGVDQMRIEAANERATADVVRGWRAARPETIYLAVYRLGLVVYYRRLARGEYQLLEALGAGEALGDAIGIAFRDGADGEMEPAGAIQEWFAMWAQLGWLTSRKKRIEERDDEIDY